MKCENGEDHGSLDVEAFALQGARQSDCASAVWLQSRSTVIRFGETIQRRRTAMASLGRRPPSTLNKPEGAEPYSDGALREARRVVSISLSLELWEYSLLDDGPQRTPVKMAGAARALVGVP